VVDGGTNAGVMAMMGQARTQIKGTFPLLGVAAVDTVELTLNPGRPKNDAQRAALEPHHTHIILVPGQHWGAESPWLAQVATVLARGHPSVTILINGGQISRQDVDYSLRAKRPVIVVAGTGRLADELVAAPNHPSRLHIVDLTAGVEEIARYIQAFLLKSPPHGPG